MLQWTDVDSSNVSRVSFHEDTKTICVQFANGGLYAYSGADNAMFVSLVHAESVGKYLNSVVKAECPYAKFNDEAELLSSLAA